ncbi:MAG: hypothetical protein U1E73_00415 [Planctomycetota bacterium]
MRRQVTALAALAAAAVSLAAQTQDHLVGITRVFTNLRQVDHWNCAPLGSCPVPLPAAVILAPAAGGTAWDPVRPGAWVTTGTVLAKVDDTCNAGCGAMPIPGLAANTFVTGLEVVQSLDELWAIDALGDLHSFTNTCPPNPINVCNTGLVPAPAGVSTSGLAVDEGDGAVFYAYCNFTTGQSRIAVARLQNPCQILCQVPVQAPCTAAFGAITGLACDWGNHVLYATDGTSTLAIRYAFTGALCVQFLNIDCCTPPVAVLDPMIGLAIRPGGATSHGTSCNNGACPNCPMIHSLGNDPVLGNAHFRLVLEGAPVPSLAWCLIGVGPCQVPGLSVPPLCGPVHTLPLLGTLGPNPPVGAVTNPCSGMTSYAFPLPPWPSLVGWTISSQCVSLCATSSAIGTAMSNCLSFTFQGS